MIQTHSEAVGTVSFRLQGLSQPTPPNLIFELIHVVEPPKV